MIPAPIDEQMDRPHVLIVDDDPRNVRVFEAMLEPQGYRLSTAAGGEEALSIVRRDPPDVILLDVMMPGIDGYQVTARLKSDAATAGIHVLLITALNDGNSTAHGVRVGALDVLGKPTDRLALVERVRQAIEDGR